MILNTSFNGRGQPIVESPEEAIKAFLSFRGSMDSLFIGDWVLTRRSFPLLEAINAAAVMPSLTVQAEAYYRSETAAPSPAAPDSASATTVRVDVGQDSMIELPSQLHFDLLQLLQPSAPGGPGSAGDYSIPGGDKPFPEMGSYLPPGMEGSNAGDNNTGCIGVGELFAAMEELGEDVTWGEFKGALGWLYERTLVSFEDEEEADPQKLFDGAEVLDLRT